ncbi:MAG: hypothetical protein GEU73_05070 [Chloroflexi bacterium]|nr:hypothetical protein [Chloroflexota bacterium]
MNRRSKPTCKSKFRHGTKEAAERAMSAHRANGEKFDRSLCAYWCEEHGAWHVGHDWKRKSRKAKSGRRS